ncbi:MAG: hypothetical protein HWN65_00455 [Candidatus Helarchaeota archaeon]|nr:hypothetical protein [Candidatus Helarchaeota archaeon]
MNSKFEERKNKLIDELLARNYIFDAHIEAAFRKVPMENFLPESVQNYCYMDIPLPFYRDVRPIAAPHINAIFLQLLQIEPGNRILQLSSMSGYFAALSSEIADSEIRIVEEDPEIVQVTRANLKRSGYDKIEVVEMDPIRAFWEFPDSNRIIFCGAVAASIIDELSKAMPNDSILIAPTFPGLFNPLIGQDMIRVTKSRTGEIKMESFGKVSFILMQSKSFQKQTSKTQHLIYDQIEKSLEDYFQNIFPREAPLLNLNLPEHIMEDFFAANTLYKKDFKKAAILQALLTIKEAINYVLKDAPIDFTQLKQEEVRSKLEHVLTEAQLRIFETLLDIESSIVNYNHQNPPNIEKLAKMALDIASDFLENRFRD